MSGNTAYVANMLKEQLVAQNGLLYYIDYNLSSNYALWTKLIMFVDVLAVGPNESKAGLASFNTIR